MNRGRTCKYEISADPACRSRWSGWVATISAAGTILRRRARSCTGRSISASRCSTPRISTASAAAPRNIWARASATGARTSCSRPNSAWRWTTPAPRKGASRRYIMSAIEASLRRLKTDWIDLYQVHRHDPLTPIEETLETLTDLVRAGKVRYFGCSNFSAAQMTEAQWAAKYHGLHGFVSAQDEYSLLKRGLDAENLPMMERYGLGLLPYFPLASGLLSGKHKRGALAAGSRLTTPAFTGRFTTDANFDIVEKLDAFVKARGHTLLELAFSWLAARPTVGSVIAGATKPEQIEA